MAAPFFSTRSENLHLRRKLPCYAFCRNTNSNVLAVPGESGLTCGLLQLPTETCRPLSALDLFVMIYFTVCMFSRFTCRHFGNAPAIFPSWLNTLSIATREKPVSA